MISWSTKKGSWKYFLSSECTASLQEGPLGWGLNLAVLNFDVKYFDIDTQNVIQNLDAGIQLGYLLLAR